MKRETIIGLVLAVVLGGLVGYTIPRNPTQSSVGVGDDPKASGARRHAWTAKDQSHTVAYVLPNDGPYYDLKWHGVSEELKKLGYEPQKFNSNAYKNIKAQTDILENLIQKRVAAIILHPVSDTAVVPFVDRAYDAGIPVIAENVDIKSDKVAGRVMLANFQNGWELAMALARDMGGKGKVAALVGPPGVELSDEMWRGAKDYLSHFPEIKIVREEYLQANTPEALQRVQSILSAHPDLRGIYTWYIQNGIGAAEAVRQAGIKPGSVSIVAKDTSPQGDQLLREGYLQSLLVGEPITMGRESARMVDAVLKGAESPRTETLRNVLMERDTISSISRAGFELPK